MLDSLACARLFTDERRGADRHAADLPCNVLTMGEGMVPARIIDISATGCAFRADHHHPVGARVWIMLDYERNLPARLVWYGRGLHGCAFLKPLSSEDVLMIAKLIDQTA